MRQTALRFLVLFLLSAILYGCGSGSVNVSESAADSAAGGPAEQAVQTAAAAQASPGSGPPVTDRKIIQNAELDLRVKDADAAIAAIGQGVRSAGGYVQETRVEGNRQQGRRVRMIIRVPAGAYGSVIDLVAGLGEVTDRREWINDVTEEYLDVEARLRTKEAHLEQLRKLYERGGTIKELMELEQEIARVTAELESIKGRYNFLSNQVAYSTITIGLSEPGAPAPIEPPRSVWERMKHGFIDSWNGMVNLTAEIAIFIVSAIPPLLYLAVAGMILWGLIRWASRHGGGGPGGGAGGGPPGTPVAPTPYRIPSQADGGASDRKETE